MASCYQSQAMSVSGFKMLEGVRSQAALRIKNTRDVGGGVFGDCCKIVKGISCLEEWWTGLGRTET